MALSRPKSIAGVRIPDTELCRPSTRPVSARITLQRAGKPAWLRLPRGSPGLRSKRLLASAALVQVFRGWARIHVGPPNSFVASVARAIKAKFTAAFAVRYADSQRLTSTLAPLLSPRP